MNPPKSRSNQLATHLLTIGSTDLNLMLNQLHPEDLAAAWRQWLRGGVTQYGSGIGGRNGCEIFNRFEVEPNPKVLRLRL
jgi:hypothetical protein